MENGRIQDKSRQVFTRKGSGAKKIAPVDMRKEEHQFVIDAYLVDEVLSQLPPTLKIVQALVFLQRMESSGKIVTPNELKKLGVVSTYRKGSRLQTSVLFDKTSKEKIKENISTICHKLGYDRKRAYFQYIVLSNGEGTVKFQHCTKEIKPDELDLRNKLRVLGAILGEGKVQSTIADLNAKKYKCVIKEQPVKFVMCYKE